MSAALHLAYDLGAGSGRAVLGRVDASGLLLREVHRFHYPPRCVAGSLRWDWERLVAGLWDGIRHAQREAEATGGRIESMGVDSWGVDYGLIDAEGRLIEEPVSYRDERTRGLMEDVCARLTRADIYARTGIQFLTVNTLYQLVAHARSGLPPRARLLLVADLCHHLLCGSVVSERTNASTTQLLRVDDGRWDETLLERLCLPSDLFPEVVPAGTDLGTLLPRHQADLGVGAIRVIAPATHDTASAVVGTPLEEGWAYISSGTWSLVGVERDAPLLSDSAARASFTNEAGAFGTIRFLKNVMGLWILDACRREWKAKGDTRDHAALLLQSEAAPGSAGLVFPDDPRFFNPPRMAAELRASLAETGQDAPDDPILLTKVVLDSLALRYASVLAMIEEISGQDVAGIHVMGGGALNKYLNQATADAFGRPVSAGPVEATALGNVVVQAIACGKVPSVREARRLVRRSAEPSRFTPRRPARWAEAARRFRDLEEAWA